METELRQIQTEIKWFLTSIYLITRSGCNQLQCCSYCWRIEGTRRGFCFVLNNVFWFWNFLKLYISYFSLDQISDIPLFVSVLWNEWIISLNKKYNHVIKFIITIGFRLAGLTDHGTTGLSIKKCIFFAHKKLRGWWGCLKDIKRRVRMASEVNCLRNFSVLLFYRIYS